MMDTQIINLILGALGAGALASVKDTASQAVKDAYSGLKTLLEQKLVNQPKAQAVLLDYEEDPETYEKPLAKALSVNHLDQDEAIIAAARHVMSVLPPQQALIGRTNIQNFGKVQGQVGENVGSITMHFGETDEA